MGEVARYINVWDFAHLIIPREQLPEKERTWDCVLFRPMPEGTPLREQVRCWVNGMVHSSAPGFRIPNGFNETIKEHPDILAEIVAGLDAHIRYTLAFNQTNPMGAVLSMRYEMMLLSHLWYQTRPMLIFDHAFITLLNDVADSSFSTGWDKNSARNTLQSMKWAK